MAPYSIERFQPPLLRGVALLRQALWGKSLQANMAYLQWMYGQNPYINEPPLFVALHQGVPVGMRGTLGTRWKCQRFDAEHTLPSLTDTGIAPDHRDRGLYAELTNWALEEYAVRGYSHVLNMTPNSENFIASTLSTGGFKSFGEHGTLVRSNRSKTARATRVERRLLQRLGIHSARSPFIRPRVMRRTRGQHARGISISASREPRPVAMAELVARLGVDERIHHTRDSPYFAWRYRNPLAFHYFVYAKRGPALVGYAVLQSPRSGGAVDIVDLEGIDDAVRHALIHAIAGQGFATLKIWSSTLAADMVSDLTQHGFSTATNPERYAERLILRPLTGDSADSRWSIDGVDLRRLANWKLCAAIATTY